MAAFVSAAAVMTVVVATDHPASAAPPPKKTVTHVSEAFTCTNYEHEILGGGTLAGLIRRTTLTPLEGELSRTHVEGWYRFVADNGERIKYRIDYFRITLDSYETMWEGWFIVDDLITENYWYADPGEARFSGGGYVFAGPPWRSVCDELVYELGVTD